MLKSKKIIGKARVLYPFKAQNRDELNLKVEDVVNILQKDLPDEGWWLGEINGVVGVFPDNFVKLLPDKPELAKNQFQKDRNSNPSDDSITSAFDCMKSSSKKLTHITATRVKGPQRRPPSHLRGKNDGENSSSSSVVSVVLNKETASSGGGRELKPSMQALRKVYNEQLDSCWGNGQDSPDSTSPRLLSSESPDSLHAVPVLKNKSSKNLSRLSNGSKEGVWKVKKETPLEKKVLLQGRKADGEREGSGDRMARERSSYGGKAEGTVPMQMTTKDAEERISLEEYEGLLRKVEALRRDIRDQAQTNDRMVQTLKNFLQDEKVKVGQLAAEFERLRNSVVNDITFL